MNSAIYRGWVRHRRFAPTTHSFSYRVLMLLLDLDEVDFLSQRIRLFSTTRRTPIQFHRTDYWGNPTLPLKAAILDLVQERTGCRPGGPVKLLTQPRMWGIGFNPISVYYCYGMDGASLEATVAEVTNTPWGDRCCYVLPGNPARRALTTTFEKSMHVSPFMAMNQRYHWRSRPPGNTLAVHIESREQGETNFDATLSLRRQPLTSTSLASCVVMYPLVTAKVIAAIHWEALRLFVKGVPVHPHPGKNPLRTSPHEPLRTSTDRACSTSAAETGVAPQGEKTLSSHNYTSLETLP